MLDNIYFLGIMPTCKLFIACVLKTIMEKIMKILTKLFAVIALSASVVATAGWGWGPFGNNDGYYGYGPHRGYNTNWGPFDGRSDWGPFDSRSNWGPFDGRSNWGPFSGANDWVNDTNFGFNFDTKNKTDNRYSGRADAVGSGRADAYATGRVQAEAIAHAQAEAYNRGYAAAQAEAARMAAEVNKADK